MFRRIIRVILALLLGIFPAIWIVQNNKSTKEAIFSSLIKYLEKKWNSEITIEKIEINLFTGVITLDQLQIHSKNKPGCLWTCKKGRLHIMPRDSLRDNALALQIELNNNIVETEYEKKLGIAELLKTIFKIKSEYFKPQAFFINNLSISIPKIKSTPQVIIDGSFVIKNDQHNLWHGRLQLDNGSFCHNNNKIITKLCGVTSFHQTGDSKNGIELYIDKRFSSQIGQNDSYSLRGKWDKNKKNFSLKNDSGSTILSLKPPGKTSSRIWKLDGAVDLGHFYPLEKTAIISSYISPQNNAISANITLPEGNQLIPKNISIDTTCNNPSLIHASGESQLGRCYMSLDLKSSLPIRSLSIIKKQSKVSLSKTSDKFLAGHIDYSYLHSLLPVQIQKLLVSNKGQIKTTIKKYSPNEIEGTISLSDATIHIPGSYNLITGLKTDFLIYISQKKILLKNISLSLKRGDLTCEQAILHWNEAGEITFAHAHIQAKKLLINWKNDFFAFIDGTALVSKQLNEMPKISGDVIIKKSLFKESIFSGELGQPFENKLFKLDLNISNEEPLSIKTPFLKTEASANLTIKLDKSLRISGGIVLRKGTLSFPKNKLFISSGRVDFIPTQINNPMVTLVAKNRIKKYVISLHVSGQLQKPTVFLESNPELTEEQIIALLFAGSEHMSFRSDLPTIIMQNLSTLILGNKKYLSRSSNFFKNLTKPFKYIQITPHFTDQSGRGGVRGSVSVDINKRLHAQIQKNLTTQEDFAFQIEYFLSDNFNVKAAQDHRGDIGVELELIK